MVDLYHKYLPHCVIFGLVYRKAISCLFCNAKLFVRACCRLTAFVLLIRANKDSVQSAEQTEGALALSKTI